MSGLLFDRQRSVVTELLRLIEQRRTGESALRARLDQAEEKTRTEAEALVQQLTARREQQRTALESAHRDEQEAVQTRCRAELLEEQKGYAEAVRALEREEKETREKLNTSMQDLLWAADSLMEAGQKRVQKKFDTVERAVADAREQCALLRRQFEPLLARSRLTHEHIEPRGEVPRVEEGTLEDLNGLLERAASLCRIGHKLRVRRWLRWRIQIGICLLCLGLAAIPAFFLEPWWLWLGLGAVLGLLIAPVQRSLLKKFLRRQMLGGGRAFALLLAQVGLLGEQLVAQAQETARAGREALEQQHRENRQKAEARYRPQLEQLERRMRSQRQTLEQKHRSEQERLRQQGQAALLESQALYEKARADCQTRIAQALDQARHRASTLLEQLRRERQEVTLHLRAHWEAGCQRLLEEIRDLQGIAESFTLAPRTDEADIPAGLPLGSLALELAPLLGDLRGTSLAPWPEQTQHLPAFLPFPERGALLLQTQGGGKSAGIQALQALTLRFLTALPPGKVRFIFFDPVGLGDSFAAFMHLADHDEALVTSRIWTEPAHIESQLADLTEHMETVIQKYLRSQFHSIEQYNAAAGEVAEPYRVLVVSHFPAGFTPQAARRLLSVIQSGASCGVHVLLSADARQPMPQDFRFAELADLCLNLRWLGTRFVWDDPDLDRFPLTLEAPPENARIIEIVHRVGARSKDASRVEVPFAYIAPRQEEVWGSDSRRGIVVPLGRAGAVRRLNLELGKGTAQHVLVAGKTGSGKSTLWHALIVNLALHYSPDELELYLIDFKKGVEFKVYAECGLPHARVIAIESEREFGLSVLQNLDALLRERGDRFRDAGVNDIASFREAHPQERMPRVLLVVDEFQEFFVEDDRLSQEAALLFDRLVRQGRAFGLHVLLGSQTLGGVYSLARSTIDQMAVRIALQCSEADAQLILNKDNSAARLLSRPGEAIYNNGGGALEANELFQVVWLPEEERERIVRSLQNRARAGRPRPIVFESSVPAELQNNSLLLSRLTAEEMTRPEMPRAWLGEAIAIKDPTAAIFRRQTGSNLLIVGQHEEAALGLLASSLVSLAVQHASAPARLLLLDGLGSDEPLGDYVPALVQDWPRPVERLRRGELPATLASLAEEVSRRLKGADDRQRCYLLIHGIQRFREFRRSEDDFGLGRRGADRTVSPAEHFQTLLRDGPGVGIHLLLWCDQLTNLNRVLDRQGLRECGLRVLFQMSPADSSHLLDSPAASKLGRHRALFFHDELTQPEKFRPYGLPSLGWLREVKSRLSLRSAVPVAAIEPRYATSPEGERGGL